MHLRRPLLLLRISFPGRPIFMQFIPDHLEEGGLAEPVPADHAVAAPVRQVQVGVLQQDLQEWKIKYKNKF